MPEPSPPPPPHDPPDADSTQPGLPRQILLQSDSLLQGRQEVLIQHGPEVYRLRITRNGKLILCK